MKRYPEYKDSDADWIREIPARWKMINTKYLFRLVTEPAQKNNDYELLSIYTDIGVKPRKQLEERGNRATTTDGYWLVKKDDFIVNKLLAWMGAIGLSDYEGVTSPAYDILRKIRPLNERFYEYLFRCGLYFTEFKKWSRGIMEVRLRLYFDQFGQIPLVFPPVDEQDKIVDFLDCKTGQIDELIRIKERRIELLQEQRTALINHAVTKGLDPNVEMKPSGVEWIEEIPAHWEILKVKYVGSSNPSKNNPKTTCLKEKPVVFLPMERVHTDGTIDQELRLPYSQLKNGYTYFEENDVLIAKVTPCFENGKIVLIKNLATPVGFGSTEFTVIRPNTQKVFSLFLYYILYNVPLRSIGKHFMTSAVGLKRVPTEFVENFRIPIPPKREQAQIANFLELKTRQIDDLISTEQRKIDLLKEYRQSLISEAVTGKIDVRNEV